MKFGTLIIFSILLLSGCRTIEKTFSSAYSKRAAKSDSSGIQTEQNTSKYNRETITEYILDTLWRTRTVQVPDVHVVEVPKPYPYYIKQTVRENGESTQDKTEISDKSKTKDMETKKVETEKTASFPLTLQWAALLGSAGIILIGVALLIKQFK